MEASAIRLRAARKIAQKEQRDMAQECGVSNTVLSNAENGLTYPSREIMSTYWRGYEIDFNFLINGSFNHLSPDLQDRLFFALEAATSEWDRKESSNRSRSAKRSGQSQTQTSQA
ncbi:helix-turn-helix transcriptional regulator [Frigidibacter sp. MR17.14]|uniref:helix-turn-helix domain-containing protein n=1 Tax=Frigidibacter sp. MR17.14 TaxID=3126509 RepID=UPI003012FBD7